MTQLASLSRRSVLRLIAAGSAAALVPAAARRPEPASAARVWCRTDPLFQVGTKYVDVTIGTYDDMFAAAVGAVQIILWTPHDVPVRLIWADNGFGYGYAITYAVDPNLKGTKDNPQVRVDVLAPATTQIPVSVYYSTLTSGKQMEFRSSEHAGESNQLISVYDVQKVVTSTVSTSSTTTVATPTPTPAPVKRR